MNIEIAKTSHSRLEQVDFNHLGFGEIFSDHMLDVEYSGGTWGTPRIVPYGPFQITPAMSTLHYGQAIFEGLKVFRTAEGRVQMFRFDKHHARLNKSCRRLGIPEVSYELFMEGLSELVKLDQAWIPTRRGTSLYVRPFIFASEDFLGVRLAEKYRFMIITSPVGAFYKEGINPVKLVTSGDYVRAVRGGLGAAKTPANYAASLLPAHEAKKKGFTQVLWLDALEHRYLEEVGTMNIFVQIGDELITPPLDGTILDGVTRDSVLGVARSWGMPVSERRVTIEEVLSASAQGTLKEMFGAGTAAVISPVGLIEHQEEQVVINNGKIGVLAQKLYDEITAIQYGEKKDSFGWCYTL
jgi:branched-chain amino acid aminotransferase